MGNGKFALSSNSPKMHAMPISLQFAYLNTNTTNKKGKQKNIIESNFKMNLQQRKKKKQHNKTKLN